MLTLDLTDRDSGVPLLTTTVPATPALSPVIGQNKLSITWSVASGETARETVELRVLYDDPANPIDKLTVNFGDGSGDQNAYELGIFADEHFLHVYTGSGPFTITATLRKDGSVVTSGTQPITPALSADYIYNQVQFERLRNDVSEFRVDWRNRGEVATGWTDHEVKRGFTYKYRVRLRTLDGEGLPNVTSQFSAIVTQVPWS